MSAQARYDWTPERVADLRRLWAEGLSASLIAQRLGVSRSAVLGKLYRTEVFARGAPSVRLPANPPWRGVPSKPTAIKAPAPSTTAAAPKRTPTPAKSVAPKSVTPKSAAPTPVSTQVAPLVAPKPSRAASAPEPAPIASPTAVLLDLGARQCKWPIGDPAREGFGFCGAAREGASPYCAPHTRGAFVAPPKPRAQRAADLVRLAGKYR